MSPVKLVEADQKIPHDMEIVDIGLVQYNTRHRFFGL